MSSPLGTLLAVGVSVAGGIGLGFAAYRFEPVWQKAIGVGATAADSPADSERRLGQPAEPEPESEPDHEPEPDPSASAEPGASAEPVASASTGARTVLPIQDLDRTRRCLTSMFPADKFSAVDALDFVCSEPSGIRVAKDIKATLASQKRSKPSSGLKEWNVLGFYSLASAAVIRGRCCEGAPSLTMPATPAPCQAMDQAMTSLATAVKKRGNRNEAMRALALFENAVRCILKTRDRQHFGGYQELRGGEATTFDRILTRALR